MGDKCLRCKLKFLLMFHLLSRKTTPQQRLYSYESYLVQSLVLPWSAERAAKARTSWTVRSFAPHARQVGIVIFRDLGRERRAARSGGLEGLGGERSWKK